jgi:hypothetical protein
MLVRSAGFAVTQHEAVACVDVASDHFDCRIAAIPLLHISAVSHYGLGIVEDDHKAVDVAVCCLSDMHLFLISESLQNYKNP